MIGTNILILRRKWFLRESLCSKINNNALPLDTDKEVAVFGRIQFHYYKSGTGSGGMVNVTKVVNILDGLIDNGVKVNEKLLDTYRNGTRKTHST